jgi:hypothetical protein
VGVTFAEQYTGHVQTVLLNTDHLGCSVVYRTPDTDDVTVTAIVTYHPGSLPDGSGGQSRKRTATAVFASSDITSIHPKATVFIDGEEWAVTFEGSVVMKATSVLKLIYVGKAEFTREGLRR